MLLGIRGLGLLICYSLNIVCCVGVLSGVCAFSAQLCCNKIICLGDVVVVAVWRRGCVYGAGGGCDRLRLSRPLAHTKMNG